MSPVDQCLASSVSRGHFLRTFPLPGATEVPLCILSCPHCLGMMLPATLQHVPSYLKGGKDCSRSHAVQMNPYLGGMYINAVVPSLVLVEENDPFMSHSPKWWTYGRT